MAARYESANRDCWRSRSPTLRSRRASRTPTSAGSCRLPASRRTSSRRPSKSRDIVLDPFGGSGSTLIACQHAGRQARLIELDPKYCDVIVRRVQDWTGEVATLEGDGRSFEEIAAGREAAAV